MRIAMLAWETKHSIAVGGMAEHVTALAAALARRGHELHVFTRIGADQARYELIDGVHYHRCPCGAHADFNTANERFCDSLIWHLAETESYLAAPFDIVHGHDWLAVRALVQAKNRHRRCPVLTVHSTEYGRCGNQLFEGSSRRIRDLEWEGAYVAERIICVSGALKDEVHGLYGVPKEKMNVVYNGVDVTRFDNGVRKRETRRRIDVGVDDPMVLFAGRMTWQKGPDMLVDAAPRILGERPDAKFVFAGEGDMRWGLEERVRGLGTAPSNRFLGYRNGRDLVGLFKSADVVCVPSRNEPFGIVILEAWGARKPVVATRNGGPAEFVRDNDTGLTVKDDPESIGAGLSTLLSDAVDARRMGRNGRREAETKFSWPAIATQTELIYQEALRNGLA